MIKKPKLTYVKVIAKQYNMDRRTVLGRLDKNGVKGFIIGRRLYYEMSEEIHNILSVPVLKHAKYTKKPSTTIAENHATDNQPAPECDTQTEPNKDSTEYELSTAFTDINISLTNH